MYDENALIALDTVLDVARNTGMKVILTFTDNWKVGDSKQQYAEWAGISSDEFFTDLTIRQWFKDHIKFMTERVNTQNGIVYRDDPTIFAWNIINEPRCNCDVRVQGEQCEPECADEIQAWIEEMSQFIKEQDPIHMITIGEEGFYSFNSGREYVNPDNFADPERLKAWLEEHGRTAEEAKWALRSGQDFIRNHDLISVDYGAIHVWPDNWGRLNISFQEFWVREHIADAQRMGKPLVVEEFGKIVENNSEDERIRVRDPFFSSMYNLVEGELQSDSPLKGVAFWEFDPDTSSEPGEYGVQVTHTTWNDIIVPFSQYLDEELKKRPIVENCVPGDTRSYDAVFIGNPSNVYYRSAGVGVLALDEGDDLGETVTSITGEGCAQMCEDQGPCDAFSYNANREGGSCAMKSGSSEETVWNGDGWQTYYRTTGSIQCSLKHCAVCSNNDTCLKCSIGRLLFRDASGELSCKKCNEAPEEIKSKRVDCQLS